MKKMLKALAAGIIFAAALTMTACVLPGSSEGSNPLAPIGVDYMDAKLGDIILDNGHICKPDDFDKTTMKPVAIIIREVSESRCALGIALKEGSNKPWCISTAEGYQNIPELSNSLRDSTTAHATLLKNVKDYSAVYYPAWGYCASYGITNSLPLTFMTGWCLPTTEELVSLGSNYNKYIGTFSKFDSSTWERLKYGNTDNLYVSCNQSGNQAYFYELKASSNSGLANKSTGNSQYDNPNATKTLIARPVYHFTNNAVTIYKPVISDKSNNSVTIKCYTPGTTIYYRVDNGRLQSATAPATVPLDSSEHKITAYAAKLGCHNSATVEKTIPADGVY